VQIRLGVIVREGERTAELTNHECKHWGCIDLITPVSGAVLRYVHSVYMNQKIVFVKIKLTVVITSTLRTFD